MRIATSVVNVVPNSHLCREPHGLCHADALTKEGRDSVKQVQSYVDVCKRTVEVCHSPEVLKLVSGGRIASLLVLVLVTCCCTGCCSDVH